MQYGDELAKRFKSAEDSENYDRILMNATRFITSSPQSALETLAAGSKPVYLEKPGSSAAWRSKLFSFGIPFIENFSKEAIVETLRETFVYDHKVLRKDAAIAAAHYIKDKLS